MTSICCTIYEEQSLVYWTVCEAQSAQYARRKVYRCVENRLFCKETSIYRCAACFACKHLVVWQNISQQQDISTKHQQLRIEFVSRQPNTVDSLRSVELAFQCMEMLNKRWTHIHSHQRFPSSVLRLCCPSIRVSFALQIVQSASLHSFKLVFLKSAWN